MTQTYLNQYLIAGIGVLIIFVIILFIMLLINMKKVKRMTVKYNRFMKDASSGGNLDNVIEKLIDNDSKIFSKIKEIIQDINKLRVSLSYCGQKITMIRYNAFDNVGSNQSYSLAVLDERDNGFVLTGIYARDSSSTYAKPIEQGISQFPLSQEEVKAIEECKRQFISRVK